MTEPAEQAAREIVRKWKVDVGTAAVPERDYYEAHDYDVLVTNIARLLLTRERTARREERERLLERLEIYCVDKRTDRDSCPCLVHNLIRALRRDPVGDDVTRLARSYANEIEREDKLAGDAAPGGGDDGQL